MATPEEEATTEEEDTPEDDTPEEVDTIMPGWKGLEPSSEEPEARSSLDILRLFFFLEVL